MLLKDVRGMQSTVFRMGNSTGKTTLVSSTKKKKTKKVKE